MINVEALLRRCFPLLAQSWGNEDFLVGLCLDFDLKRTVILFCFGGMNELRRPHMKICWNMFRFCFGVGVPRKITKRLV